MPCLLQIGLDPGGDPSVVDADPAGQFSFAPVEGTTTATGRYKLLRQIGEGSFGVVYLAEQKEPIRRQVALKVLRPEVLNKEVLARFETEWRALSMMDHSCIAEVFDTGSTSDGRPFFVMEFVNGVPITEYCDQHNFSIRQRLDLFIQVCRAVQHAHQKGVIHRDIKPSNLLVTESEGQPTPKVIDFGIAKAALGQRPIVNTQVTLLHHIVGTPGYMSPEQAGLGGLDVDVRSDIYSLGILLYELLTAQPAFSIAEFQRVAEDEILRTIREKDPLRPSTRLANMTREELAAIATRRGADPGDLSKLVRGDLDWIVMRALEKDRTRRYETADGLATDVRRYLDNEPVVARPPSRLYRFQKLVRRHRVVFAASTAVALALILAVGVSWSMFLRERTAAVKSSEMASFLEDMLRSVKPSVARGRDTKLLREILNKTRRRVGIGLKSQPEVEADLRSLLGSVYLGIGDYSEALAMHSQALVIRTNLLGSEHLKVADSLSDLGKVLFRQGKFAESEKLATASLEIRTRLLGNTNQKVADSLNTLANDLWFEGNLAKAETLHRQALTLRRSLGEEVNEDILESLDNLAGVLSSEDKLSEAETMHREAVMLNKKLVGDAHPDVAFSLNNLGDTLRVEGKWAEAEAIDQQALKMRHQLLGDEHPDFAASLFSIGTLLWNEGRLPEAEATNRLALAIRRKVLGNDNIDVAGSLNNLAAVLIDEHKLAEAEQCQQEALGIQRKLIGPDHEDIAGSLDNLSSILQGQGKTSEALAMQRDALAMRERLFGEDHLDVASSYFNMAFLLELKGRLDEAETNAIRALDIRRKHLDPNHPDIAASLAILARILSEGNKFADAERLLVQELIIWRAQLASTTPHTPASVNGLADVFTQLAGTLLEQGKFPSAETLTKEFVSFAEKELPDDWRFFNSQSLLGGALLGQNKFNEAEPLLLSGYNGMNRLRDKIPSDGQPQLIEAIHRIILYYKSANRTEEIKEWQKKMDAAR